MNLPEKLVKQLLLIHILDIGTACAVMLPSLFD